MDEEGLLKIVNEKGEQKEFHILFTLNIQEKNKSYIVYTDYSKDENGKVKTYSARYNSDDEESKLEPVVEQEEKDIIKIYLKELAKS